MIFISDNINILYHTMNIAIVVVSLAMEYIQILYRIFHIKLLQRTVFFYILSSRPVI